MRVVEPTNTSSDTDPMPAALVVGDEPIVTVHAKGHYSMKTDPSGDIWPIQPESISHSWASVAEEREDVVETR